MKHATLRQLKVFESVARLLSFSRAAEELHLTQPAVSTQVKKLEEHAGMPLFEQFGKKIYLTAAGVELLEISRCVIAQFEAAESAMTQLKGVSGGKLNVAVISAGDYFFRVCSWSSSVAIREWYSISPCTIAMVCSRTWART